MIQVHPMPSVPSCICGGCSACSAHKSQGTTAWHLLSLSNTPTGNLPSRMPHCSTPSQAPRPQESIGAPHRASQRHSLVSRQALSAALSSFRTAPPLQLRLTTSAQRQWQQPPFRDWQACLFLFSALEPLWQLHQRKQQRWRHAVLKTEPGRFLVARSQQQK